MAVGLITDPDQAEAIVQEGRADFVALARAVLDDPHWGWHAAYRLGVEPRLRAVLLVETDDGLRRCRRQPELLRLSTEGLERLAHVVDRHLLLERGRHALGVPVEHRHARRLGADDDRMRFDGAVVHAAENALGLALQLLFFAADVGDDIVNHVECAHAVEPRARHRL